MAEKATKAETQRKLHLAIGRLERLLNQAERGQLLPDMSVKMWKREALAALSEIDQIRSSLPSLVEMARVDGFRARFRAVLSGGLAPGAARSADVQPRLPRARQRAARTSRWKPVDDRLHLLRPGHRVTYCGIRVRPRADLPARLSQCRECAERDRDAQHWQAEQEKATARTARRPIVRFVPGGAPGLGKR
jgi:hypothetical protein